MMLFDSFPSAYWQMLVCLTTENYPDVMLYAQEVNAWYTIFFIVFILVGCFFLSSVLLAVIFDNWKNRIEILHKTKISRRKEYIEMFFDHYDEQSLNWLTMKQSKAFFSTVLDLNYKKFEHRKLLSKIMKIVDPEDNKFVLKERVLEFFEISGFAIIGELCQDQMQIDTIQRQSFNFTSGLRGSIPPSGSIISPTNKKESSGGGSSDNNKVLAGNAPSFGRRNSTDSANLRTTTGMPEIREEDSDNFSIQIDLDQSMRMMINSRKLWQKKGI